MNNKFTVRIVLLDTENDWEIYDKLHKAMEKEGFSKTIIGNNGKEYHLPDAEYNLIGEYSAENVMNMSKRAAATTGREYSVLITPSSGRYWHNLKPVNVFL